MFCCLGMCLMATCIWLEPTCTWLWKTVPNWPAPIVFMLVYIQRCMALSTSSFRSRSSPTPRRSTSWKTQGSTGLKRSGQRAATRFSGSFLGSAPCTSRKETDENRPKPQSWTRKPTRLCFSLWCGPHLSGCQGKKCSMARAKGARFSLCRLAKGV